MRRHGCGWATASVLAVAAAWFGAAPAAAPAAQLSGPQDAVALYSDRNIDGSPEAIGASTPSLWRGSDSTITLTGDASSATVTVEGGPSRRGFSFRLAAKGPAPLGPGVYTGAVAFDGHGDDAPGISVAGDDGDRCNLLTGQFEIRDIGRDGAGVPNRLWAVYEQRCYGSPNAAAWGEIRIGEPPTRAPVIVPSVVRWPAYDLGRPRTVVPALVIAGADPATVSGVAPGGDDPGDFGVRDDHCTGATLAPFASCSLSLAFAPTAAGTRQAALTADTTAGPATGALQGWSWGGTTAVQISGDPGDAITQNRTYNYTAANADIAFTGTAQGLHATVTGSDGITWDLVTNPANGTVLTAPGEYDQAQRASFNDPGHPGLDFTGGHRGCNELTGSFALDAASWLADGTVDGAAVRFVQHCEARTYDPGPPAERGSIQWRVGDRTAPAPWMASSASPTPLPAAPVPAPAVTMPAAVPAAAPVAAPTPPAAPAPTAAAAASAARRAPLLTYVGLVGRAGRTLRLAAHLPRAGTLTTRVTVRLHGRTLRLGAARVTARRAATKTINITLGRRILKALAHVRRAPLTASVTWRPAGAKAVRSTTTGVLRPR